MSSSRVSWKDSNLALIGSELDHKIKLASASHEDQWKALHDAMAQKDQTTLLMFRMEDFHVVPWTKLGQFHVGDTYLVFHSQPTTTNDNGDDSATSDLVYDLHIWIGSESSQDEYGTAAYKMVEADEILGGAAVQHREVQGHESEQFVSYFASSSSSASSPSSSLQYLSGGVASGFHHVEATVETPHLYRIKGTHKAMSLTQIPTIAKSSLCEGDSYILYAGPSKVWLWIGKESNPDERSRASRLAEAMCTEGTAVTLEQGDKDEADEEFWKYIGTEGDILSCDEDDGDDETVLEFTPTLYQLPVNADDVMPVATGEPIRLGFGRATPRIPRSCLQDDNVFLLDAGWELYVWVGKTASREERLAAMDHAQQYCQTNGRTRHLPISFLKAGYETTSFNEFFYHE